MALTAGSIEIKLFADLARLQSDMTKANKTVDAAMRNIDKSVNFAKRAFESLSVSFGGAQILKLADDYKRFDSQIQLSTKNLNTYNEAYSNVIRISKQAQSEIGAVGVLYARLNNNLRDFNVSQKQVSDVTETISMSLRANNATVQETSSVMLQLSQSFGSGKLNGQEFLAVAEGAPVLLRQLAKSMGVPFGALKDLSAQGQITREVLLKAWTDPAFLESQRKAAAQVGTISSAMTVLTNNLKVFIGEQDKATGSSNAIREVIMAVAENINFLASVAIVGLIAKMGRMVAASFANIQASKLHQAELLRETFLINQKAEAERVAAALSVASLANNASATSRWAATVNSATIAGTALVSQTSLLSRGLAFLGGPIGAITTALMLGITAWTAWGNAGKASAGEIAEVIDRINNGLESINDAKLVEMQVKALKAEKEAAVLREQRIVTTGARNALSQEQQNKAILEHALNLERLDREIAKNEAALKKHNQTQQENTVIVTEGDKAYQRLIADKAVLSQQIGEQTQRMQDAWLALNNTTESARISQTEYNKIIADAKKKIADLTGATKAAKDAEDERNQKLREFQASQKRNEERIRELRAEYKAFEKAQNDARTNEINNIIKTTDNLEDELKKRNDSIYALQNGEQALRDLEVARLDEAAATAEQTVAQAKQNGATEEAIAYAETYTVWLKKQAAAKREANQAESTEEMWKRAKKIEEDRIKEAEKAAEELKKINEETAKEFNKSLTDALLRGFESGKSFAQNFKETLINSFKTLILRPIISFIIDSSGLTKVLATIAGSVSGTATAGTAASALTQDSSGGLFGGVSTVFKAVTEGFDAANVAFEQSIQKFGTWVTSFGTEGSALTNIGGMISQYSDVLAKALPYAGSVIKLLSGDIKGAAFTAAGTAIGSAIGGPVGGMIGSFLGGMVGGLFGGKKKLPRYTTLLDTTYQNGIFKAGTAYKSGDSKGIIKDAIEPITQLSQAFTTTLGALLKSAGLSSDMTTSAMIYKKNNTIGRFIANIGGQQYKTSFSGGEDVNETFSRLIGETFTKVMVDAIKGSALEQGLKNLFNNLSTKEDVIKMANAVTNLNNASFGLEKQLGLTAGQAAQVAQNFAGTTDELVKVLETFTEIGSSAMTIADKVLKFKDSLTTTFNDIIAGSLPSSLADFDAVLKSIDKTTQDGIDTFSKLFALRGDFITFNSALNELRSGIDTSIFSLLTPAQQLVKMQEELSSLFGSLNMTVPSTVEELIALGESIDLTTKEGIDLAYVFPSLVDAFNKTKESANGLVSSMDNLNSSRFSSLFELTRAQSYVRGGISLDNLPKYATGTDYVTSTGPAIIHQGERIMSANDNNAFVSGQEALVEEIRSLRADNQDMRKELQSIAISSLKTSKVMDRQDRDGIIIRDVDNSGNEQILNVRVV